MPSAASVFTMHAPRGFDPATDVALRAGALRLAPAGFSPAALFLGPFWLAAKGLWGHAVALVAAYAALGLAASSGYISAVADVGVSILMAAFVALEGREWTRRRLERRGSPIADIVVAANETDAEARALRRLVAGGAR